MSLHEKITSSHGSFFVIAPAGRFRGALDLIGAFLIGRCFLCRRVDRAADAANVLVVCSNIVIQRCTACVPPPWSLVVCDARGGGGAERGWERCERRTTDDRQPSTSRSTTHERRPTIAYVLRPTNDDRQPPNDHRRMTTDWRPTDDERSPLSGDSTDELAGGRPHGKKPEGADLPAYEGGRAEGLPTPSSGGGLLNLD